MLQRDWSLSSITAGFLAVAISYAGPLIIFFQAAQAAQVGPDMMASWQALMAWRRLSHSHCAE